MSHNPVKLRVRSAAPVTSQIVAVEFESMAGLDLAPWEPGAHIEIKLPSGLLRHYSLCGDISDRSVYRIAALREDAGRGGSKELHAVATSGAVLEVRPPKNNFRLEPADDYLFLGGGIGITPILAMIQQAQLDGIPWTLVYGGRSRSSMGYVDELLSAYPGRVRIFADDAEGRPDLAGEIGATSPGTLIYACGPGPMLDLVTRVAGENGKASQLRLERFTVAAVDTAGAAFEVELARAGMTLNVGPEQTILEVVRAGGVSAAFSCENGYCGSCEAVVIDGVPEHRDTYLSDEEKEDSFTMMICVSRCAGKRLVLDL